MKMSKNIKRRMCISALEIVFCFDLMISKNSEMGRNCKEPCSKTKTKPKHQNNS